MKKASKLVTIILIIVSTIFTVNTYSQNGTPGNSAGEDKTAFLFSAFRYQGDRGENNYLLHVGNIDSMYGQQYEISTRIEGSPPDTSMSIECNLVEFYNIITSMSDSIGTLLITGHGNVSAIAIEVYEASSAGIAARDSQAMKYYYGTADPSIPQLRWGTDFFPTDANNTPVIAITDRFIRDYGNLNHSLVYIGTCDGGHLADDFVIGGARFAAGNDSSIPWTWQYPRITAFFQRLDGFGLDGQADRRADSAIGDLDTCLIWDGLPNTTLSPSVDSVIAEVPLEVGDSIIIKMETNCDTTIQPDILGIHCLIENEYWKDSLTIVGHCTWTPHPKAYNYAFRLIANSVYSANNWSYLDGNTNPIYPGIYNARGPSGDDYTLLFTDSSEQSYFINSDGYRPVTNPIGSEWERIRPDAPNTYEISDWFDDGDNILSENDTIEIFDQTTQDTIYKRIDIVTPIMECTMYKTKVYVEMIDYNPEILDWPTPIGTYWVEVSPDYSNSYQIVDWTDYDYSGDLSSFDDIVLYTLNGPDSGQICDFQIDEYMTGFLTSPICQGICGDANADGTVNVSDAIYIINYVFIGGSPPQPVLACGNANYDNSVNASDPVYIINFVFVGGAPPGDCHPGIWQNDGGDCCPFTP